MALTIAIERVDHIVIRVRDPRPRPGLLPGARVHPGTSGRGRRRRHRQLAAKFVDANKRRFGLRGGGVVLSRAARHTSSTQAAGPSEGVGPRDAMGRRRGDGTIVAVANRWSAPMPQPNDLSRSLVALDQDSTIIAVVEMSQSSWLVAGMLPGIERQPRKKLEPNAERLLGLLHRWRDEAVKAGRKITRIALAFEAGRDGRASCRERVYHPV